MSGSLGSFGRRWNRPSRVAPAAISISAMNRKLLRSGQNTQYACRGEKLLML